MAKKPTRDTHKMSEPKEPTEPEPEPTEPTEPEPEPTEPEPTEPEPTEPEPKINWRENYIRTKLYAYQGGNQSAYDALVISLLAHKV